LAGMDGGKGEADAATSDADSVRAMGILPGRSNSEGGAAGMASDMVDTYLVRLDVGKNEPDGTPSPTDSLRALGIGGDQSNPEGDVAVPPSDKMGTDWDSSVAHGAKVIGAEQFEPLAKIMAEELSVRKPEHHDGNLGDLMWPTFAGLPPNKIKPTLLSSSASSWHGSKISDLFDVMPRRKVFLSYHHHEDQAYYDAFTSNFSDKYEIIRDNSLEHPVQSNNAEYVMRRIREDHITNTSCTIVLIGRESHKRKYIDWEIKATLDKRHGLIGVMLPSHLPTFLPIILPARFQDNINSGYAVLTHWEKLSTNTLSCFVDEAIHKPPHLISNTRVMKERNG